MILKLIHVMAVSLLQLELQKNYLEKKSLIKYEQNEFLSAY